MHSNDSGRPLRQFLTYYRPHRRLFALDMLFALLSCAADLAFPYVSRQAMLRLLPLGLYRTFFAVMAALLAAYLLKAVFKYAVTVIGHRCGVLIEADMRQALFEHLQTMSFRFFDQNRTGVLMSRMTSDLFSITELAHHGPEYLLTAVVTLGGAFIMRGQMDYVDLITFSLYVTTFISPIRTLVNFMEVFTDGTAGFQRFLELMRIQPDIADAPDARELPPVRGQVDYNDVSFDYAGGVNVLSHIDLHIAPGETLAVVGPSGGGKTTLCQLLPRFYDVTQGSVCIDGIDVRTVTQASLRRCVGVLQQEVFLFADTIRENIRYGRPDATDAEIEQAARCAEIDREIRAMPDGYDTYVGERGVMLSGGQKQRLSIARLFLKNPQILILDEATSALDSVTEQRIQRALDTLARGRTCVLIAHRLSTVQGADRIAVIDGAHICEQGTPAELIARDGKYAALCRAQHLI